MPLALGLHAEPMAALQHFGSFGAAEIPEIPILLAKGGLFDDANAARDSAQRVRPADSQGREGGNLYRHAFKCLKDAPASRI